MVMLQIRLSIILLLFMAALSYSAKNNRKQLDDDPPRLTDVRRLIGSGRKRRALKDAPPYDQLYITNPSPYLLAEVLKDLGGGPGGLCHVLVYHDPKAASPDDLATLQKILESPAILIDVSKLKFSLITKSQRDVPLLDLLSNRPDQRCRLLLAWSSPNYQRGLLLILRAEQGILGHKDTVILPVEDHRLDRFLPQLKRRVLIKKRGSRAGRDRRELLNSRFLVEGVCEACTKYTLQQLGEWSQPTGWIWGGSSLHKMGLSGASVTVSYTPSVPNVFVMGNQNNDSLVLEGVEMRLLDYAAQALNFSYRLVVPEDGEWGRPVNGTWTGKVGEVIKGNADIAIGGIVYTRERAEVIEYSILFHNELWGIVCPLSVRLPVWPYIMFPFRTESAPTVFKFLVIFHVMAFLIVSLMGIQEETHPQHPLSESIYITVKTGIALYLRLMACLYFWNLFFCLMKPKYEEPITNSIALLQSGKHWGIVSGTTVTRVLSTSLSPGHSELAANAKPLDSIGEGFQQLRSDGLCLVGVPKRYAQATIATRHTTECGEPGLQISDEDLNSVLGGWIFPYGSPLIDPINSIISRLQGFGFLEHWRKEFHLMLLTKGPRDLPCLNPPLSALTVMDLRLAFLILLIGWSTAFLVHIAEHVMFYICNPMKQSNIIRRTNVRNIDRQDTNIDSAVNHNTIAPRSINDRCNINDINKNLPHNARKTDEIISSKDDSPSHTYKLRHWLKNVLTPTERLDITKKEIQFRRQLNTILRDMWGITPQ
ncbi:uncharacterized protein [Macrobrachium rosenbergii]|uniref:uncharacterized protein n=1 Tax=Macrobrachium rosenbergii TaxID=79674 RepID=UPI0034D5D1B0